MPKAPKQATFLRSNGRGAAWGDVVSRAEYNKVVAEYNKLLKAAEQQEQEFNAHQDMLAELSGLEGNLIYASIHLDAAVTYASGDSQRLAVEKFGADVIMTYEALRRATQRYKLDYAQISPDRVATSESAIAILRRAEVETDGQRLTEQDMADLLALALKKDPHLPPIRQVFEAERQAAERAEQERQEAAERAELAKREQSVTNTTKWQWEVEKRIITAVSQVQDDPRYSKRNDAGYEYLRRLEDRKTQKYGASVLSPLSEAELGDYNYLKAEADKGRKSFSGWLGRIAAKNPKNTGSGQNPKEVPPYSACQVA